MRNDNIVMDEDQIDRSEEILQIDEHHLDRECVRLPNQYRQAAFQAAEVVRDIDEAKATLKVRESELRLKIRATPGQFHLEKVTEGSIDEIVDINPVIIKQQSAIRKLEHQFSLLKALVSSLEVKKRSLTNLVELHSAGYHAEVKPSAAGREALNKISRDRISRPISRDRKERDRDGKSQD